MKRYKMEKTDTHKFTMMPVKEILYMSCLAESMSRSHDIIQRSESGKQSRQF